jgi:hypothetical protein
VNHATSDCILSRGTYYAEWQALLIVNTSLPC